ncbi:MAG TPA: hypothetical protein PLF96_11605, partial [Thermotogota bacterium]|nr:hypothetical protein [Thermotogota bacterium]
VSSLSWKGQHTRERRETHEPARCHEQHEPHGKRHALVPLIRTALLEEKNGLCAKWMPRKGEKAVWLRYRKMLVNLTHVVESKMTANEWDRIAYDTGVGLVSGFSPSIVKTLLSGETMDPVKIMKEAVCIPRYDWQ